MKTINSKIQKSFVEDTLSNNNLNETVVNDLDFRTSLIKTLKSAVPKIAESCCIVNGELMNLDEIQGMGCDEFSLRAKINMPLKLYKYFSNKPTDLIDENSGKAIIDKNTNKPKTINYHIQALRDNTVFMQSPNLFDDVYDSDISLNFNEYEKTRLLEYCKYCELNVCESMSTQELGNLLLQVLYESFNSFGNFNSIFKIKPVSEIEELSNKNFLFKLKDEFLKDGDWNTLISRVIISDFKEYSQRLQNTFRATCFTTTPYSQLMWGGSYADCHKGFCIEYTIIPNDPQYQNLFYNLFPMIYCKVRPNMTKKLAKFEDKEWTKEILWDIYFHGALRKSIDWAFQNEWRLLLPMKKNLSIKDYCVPFFPITKVFLGNRMSKAARKEIIEICHDKNIPYIGVTRNPDIFEMQECAIKCEDCPNYINN
ncbi:hypothetical protein B5E58_11255 [Tyzzerella sp. An114]|uniref:DUF2971 domain-containing protein n=1 Tax=Tyzzerella sp. An114 TaxID=1965545 RepID=UPI000B43FF95|nr:DUF2971 domain-containing protein [Tyzzerella sp. An114]OUQ56107.1 hypothetical protein B5E58_11255 [Tyzzerella sp. An114]